MKRFIPIVLAAFLLVFSGCDKTETYATLEEASHSLETETNTILTAIPVEEKFVVLYCDVFHVSDGEELDGTTKNGFSFATIGKNDKELYFIEKQSGKLGTGGETLTGTYFAAENEWDFYYSISEKDGRAVKSISDIDFSYEIKYGDSLAGSF